MDLLPFIVAFGQDWITLMSGIASVILSVASTFTRRGHPRWWLGIAAVICFFFASGRIWTVEYERAVLLEKQIDDQIKPNLMVNIDAVSTGKLTGMEGSPVYVLATVSVRNKGAQSIAERYSISVKLPNGEVVTGVHYGIPERWKLPLPNGKGYQMYSGVDSLDYKTATPIPHNGMVRGLLLYGFPTVADCFCKPGMVLMITLVDINTTTYSAFQEYNGSVIDYDKIPMFPGMQPAPITIAPKRSSR